MTVCIGSGPRQVLNVLLGVLHSQIVFCWFASVYAALATLAAGMLGKKSIIVVGGVDMAREKEFGYGLWLSPWKSALVRAAIKKAGRILVVDQSLRDEVLERVKFSGDNLEILPTGFDREMWRPSGEKKPIVLTVAATQSTGRMKVKGIDILFEVARMLPHIKFELIGLDADKFNEFIPPANMSVRPILEQEQLLEHYQRAKIYCQPSRREGLSNTLCEGMLCGCIPVASDVGGTARAVGESGIVVHPGDPVALAAGIERAFSMPESVGLNARERVVTLFPKQQRENRLKELIGEMSR